MLNIEPTTPKPDPAKAGFFFFGGRAIVGACQEEPDEKPQSP